MSRGGSGRGRALICEPFESYSPSPRKRTSISSASSGAARRAARRQRDRLVGAKVDGVREGCRAAARQPLAPARRRLRRRSLSTVPHATADARRAPGSPARAVGSSLFTFARLTGRGRAARRARRRRRRPASPWLARRPTSGGSPVSAASVSASVAASGSRAGAALTKRSSRPRELVRLPAGAREVLLRARALASGVRVGVLGEELRDPLRHRASPPACDGRYGEPGRPHCALSRAARPPARATGPRDG